MVLKQMLDLPPEGCDFIPGELEEGRKGGKVNGGARADSGRRLRRLGVIMCEDRVTCRTFQQPPESESTLASWPVELNS